MKIHLLLKKEEIDPEKMQEKVTVVFDILLATSTITAALAFGAKEVVPVLNGPDAQKEASGRADGSYVLVGEYEGATIEGFLAPNPLDLKEKVQGKSVILSTTNGTVALKNSFPAKIIYAASLLNSKTVAEDIRKRFSNETIVLVCAGSSGEFNIEDFYGAGYFIDCLMANVKEEIDLTDAANAAFHFYKGNMQKGPELLKDSRIGQMLITHGFEREVDFVASSNLFQVIPKLADNGRIINHQHVEIKK
ncbi:2-phosphosulfolactate phosphatase [Thalassobacillus cyri]|uniref:Probable 2-phosphosulfolactate phosphatase n=1 Tax=Thalassobacillus cyri TaxID=571932 RepID=A0A1H4GZ23_9BACI|nr:2-phosphosulfolactate phosphatase [Thalassobacillus cyri]SEB14827.1 2-phosphosulfolactate phosphatase [Thalassobacillus cyri]